jgi:hypothetical protein
MMIAVAILLAMILYLVDKNRKWRIFWQVTGTVLALAAFGSGILLMQRKERVRTRACALRIRRAFPERYDATADAELVRRAESKHSEICSAGTISAPDYEQPVSGTGTKDDPIIIGPDF